MRCYILDGNDSMNVVLDDIRELFKPHFDDAEIDFIGRHHPDTTSNWSNYATLRSYNIKLGVKKPDTRGPEERKRATERAMERTKMAVQSIMHHWSIHDDPNAILPRHNPEESIRDYDAPCSSRLQYKIVDPYLWPPSFAELLKRLSYITQGRDGHKEAFNHLTNAYSDRLFRHRVNDLPGKIKFHIISEDITAVLNNYEHARQEEVKKQAANDEQQPVDDAPPPTLPFRPKLGSSAEKVGNPEDYKELQRVLVLRQAPRGGDEPKTSSSEEESGEVGDDKLVFQRDLVLRQAPRQEDEDTSEGRERRWGGL